MKRYLLLLLLIAGCIADPVVPDHGARGGMGRGVLVVNQGLWRQDNSTLTWYDPGTEESVTDYFAASNPGERLGDMANSITIWRGRVYIAVSTSQAIEVLDATNGRTLGRVHLPANTEPRYVVIVDDSTAFVTGLLDDGITCFDPMTLAVRDRIAVGPAPEGIAFAAGKIFVANSGLGSYRSEESGAGELYVIDRKSRARAASIPIGSNPLSVRYLAGNGRLYALYRPIAPDSTAGGLVEIDPVSLRETRRWEIKGAGAGAAGDAIAFDESALVAYVIGKDGVYRLDLLKSESIPERWISSWEWSRNGFFSVGVSPSDGAVYIGYSKSYATAGEMLVFDRGGVLRKRFKTGLNPGAVGFP